MEEITNKKGVPAAAVVGITILAAIIFGAGAYMYANNQAAQEKDALNTQIVALQNEVLSAKKTATTTSGSSTPATNNTGDKVASTEKPSVPSDWKTYKNQKKLGYQFQYPSDLTASDAGKSDPAYPYDIEMSNEDYFIIGMTSTLYGPTTDGSIYSKEKALKDFSADSMYKKISIAGGGEGYYNTEETPGGLSWTVYFIGDKGMATMSYSKGNLSESEAEKLLRQIVGTFKFN